VLFVSDIPIVYSIHLQLPSVSGGCFLYQHPEEEIKIPLNIIFLKFSEKGHYNIVSADKKRNWNVKICFILSSGKANKFFHVNIHMIHRVGKLPDTCHVTYATTVLGICCCVK
jgi:hypothetical protein